MEIEKYSLLSLSKMMRDGELSVAEVFQETLDKADAENQKINAFISLNSKGLERAKELDNQSDKQGRLFGVPIAVKDNFCTKGITTTAGSRILKNFVPPYTAHCVERLEQEGAIILGKTNLDEFAMGSSNENSYFGPCKNPWNLDRVPGGSSGGSAAAQAAKLAAVSIGSDTGGSIRQPASFCGVVGVKPTYGSISRFGMVAFASSLDQAGPLANSVDDAALVLDIMIGKDPRDGTNVFRRQDSLGNLECADLKGLKVGIPQEYFTDQIEPDSLKVIEDTIRSLKEQGCETVEVSLPNSEHAIPVYYLIAASEASSNLSRYDGVRFGLRDIEQEDGLGVSDLADFYKMTRSRGFGDEVKRRILLGTFSLSAGYFDAYYTKACKVRRLIQNDFSQAFNSCDFIVSPVSTGAAFPLGDKINDPISMYFNDIFTTSANLAGIPAMSLPVGINNDGLPVGMQIMAPQFDDKKMLEFGKSVEAAVGFKGGIQ